MDFIVKHVASGVKTLYAFSYACTGQNRNRTMVQFWYTLVHSGRLSTVCHMYPTRGHSYNASDRDFSSLELRKRKQDTVYTPHQWFTILCTARKHMHVEMCTQDVFLDYQKHLDTFFKKSVTVKGHKTWSVTQYKMFEYTAQSKCISVSQLNMNFHLLRLG